MHAITGGDLDTVHLEQGSCAAEAVHAQIWLFAPVTGFASKTLISGL